MNHRTRKLWSWMKLNGVAVKVVAKANGVSLTAVYRFMRGDMVSAKLRKWFLAQGCPASYLPTAKTITKTRKAA